MKETKIFFPSGEIKLEGLISSDEALSAKAGIILCHPHPQYGGDMYNPVIESAVHAAFEEGFGTLRFNFRGVGESQGAYTGGVGEKEDIRAAIECLNSRFRERHHSLVLLGYSFGAWVGLPIAVQDERIKAVVAISPPLEMYDFGFFKGFKKNKLILSGDRDLYCPSSRLRAWFDGLDEPKSLILVRGADHFFFSHHQSLIPPLKKYFQSLFGLKN